MSDTMPRYPVYIPSKGRHHLSAHTSRSLSKYNVPHYIVVEPQELDDYRGQFPDANFLVLPWSGNDETRRAYCESLGIENAGLIAVRNWIRDHSVAQGATRHWQLDDNIRKFYRFYANARISCHAGVALRACEDFTDRYENIAISGLQYSMFMPPDIAAPPFYLNSKVYSCSLINNDIPYRWRLAYNDDVDICLQALSGGWCTVTVNAFMCDKLRTMTVSGGNTDDLYQGDGRLKMARSLERMWPGVVETKRRFQRPQHVVKDSWRKFDTPLKRRSDVEWGEAIARNEYGLRLVKKADEPIDAGVQKIIDHYDEQQTAADGKDGA